MQNGGIHAVEMVFLALLFFVAAFAALARKLKIPYPIVLVVAGLFLSLLPKIPHVALNPDVIFLVALPPLLYNAAWLTSWREFKYNLVSILFLAFGLVGFTVVGVAETARWAFAGFDWRLGLVLGAVVATTDAIAATAIAKRVGLPRRIVDVLEGESLVNDATGLLALEFALALLVNGHSPTVGESVARLIYLILAGLAVGLLVGLIVEKMEHFIDDGPIEIVVSLLTPYAAYLAAGSLNASGVLAVVACGLYLSRRSSQFFSPGVRLQAWAVWESLTFAINGLVFVLIGLQLPYVLDGIHGLSFRQLLVYGGLFSGIVVVLRFLWMYPGAHFAYVVRTRILKQNYAQPSARQVFVVSWTGMRGVVALAAAMSLPITLADGSPFPMRNLIVFLTFSVIFVTLVVQGLTLPPLIRALGLAGATTNSSEEQEARRIITSAALAQLEQSRQKDSVDFAAVYEDIAHHYEQRLGSLRNLNASGEAKSYKELSRHRALTKELLAVERRTAVRLRDDGKISDEVLRKIERELDLSEARLSLS